MMCIHGINLHRRNRDVLNMPRLWVFFIQLVPGSEVCYIVLVQRSEKIQEVSCV